ncbi:hypothetical protein EBZ80_23930, partial [bacterium]|nr:hypothetical protein [bacterium]
DKYVEFGRQFANVVRIRAKAPCDNPECPLKEHDQYGSAVIIRPNWILTAGHVLKGTSGATILRDDNTEYPLSHVVVHKDFEDGKFGMHDVAVGYSSKDFKAEFYPELYKHDDELGKAITFAGFGFPGTFSTGFDIKRGDHKRRAGHNKIDAMTHTVLICTPSTGSARFPLEFMITPGDSGGGMFIGNKLAGINSFLMAADKKPDGTYGDESAFTRVSLYKDWVESQIKQYELALAAQATTGPEPATHLDINESK